MSKWLERFKKEAAVCNPKSDISYNGIYTDVKSIVTSGGGTGATAASQWPFGTATVTATSIASPTITGTVTINPNTFSSTISNINYQPPYIIQFNNNGKEIVKLRNDGTVEWTNGIQIDEAAEAFAKTLALGAEMSAGITKKVKLEMRDSVFEDLIAIAKERGSLTAEDLTFLLQGSKIVEKLKGGKYES
ncbi:MAG: hypothetical protein ACHQ1D_04420 [Nitrososphaerales archaeon]